MPAEAVIDYPLISDITGARHFRPGTTCIRQAEVPADQGGSELNHCLSWKIGLSDDYRRLRLVSRPAGVVLDLTERLGACLLIYDQPPELTPEQYEPEWQELLAAGWGVWGAMEGQELFLHARHAQHAADIVVSGKRQRGAHIDCITSNAMWVELRRLARQTRP